ncbi:MAG: bifunctional nuclease family protein [Anaerolineae bacterium]|nr:MAG: bifunctional nuclease family protein [Anaerolineae bacterium]
MVEVVIDSVRVSLMSPQRLVVLRQTDAERYLPIWVGPYEAEAITVALQEIEMIRPLTHDLLKNLFTTFNARIKRVEIVALRDDIFYGNIVAESNGQVINIDSRPSDAIALAVRAHVPILVDVAVMTAASITPEQDMRSQTASSPAEQTTSPQSTPSQPARSSPVSTPRSFSDDSSRLSIFEDFLSKLDKDKKDDSDEDSASKQK